MNNQRTSSIDWGTLVVIVLLLVAGFGCFFALQHRTEAGFQRNALARIQGLSDNQIKSAYLQWRWSNPEKAATLSGTKDKADVIHLMAAIRNDLWVDNRELNPNGSQPPPAYDLIMLKLDTGEVFKLYCWLGHEGKRNPSLTMRSRKGDFNRVAQDILKRKGKPLR